MNRRTSLIAALLALLTLALFSPALDLGFVNLDDPDYVTDNPLVRTGFNWASAGAAFHTPVLGNWTPLTILSYQIDWSLYGGSPAGFHLTNLLWHAANTVLVLAVFRALGLARLLSFFLAAVFAWHPLRVESVAWIAERKDVLSGFFFLITVWCYLRHRRDRAAGEAHWSWYGIALAAFGLGLLSKPMLVTVPVVLLLLDFLPSGHPPVLQPLSLPALLRSQLNKLPFVFLSLGVGVITLATQQAAGATAGPTHGLANGIITALAALPCYLRLMLCPTGLVPLYPLPPASPVALALGGGGGLIASLAVCAWQWRRRPWLAVGWLWFLVMLFPVSGIIQVGGQFMADRYTYLPMLGLLLLLGFLLAEWRARCTARGAAVGSALAAVLLLGGLGWATLRQTQKWRDPITLWEHTLAHTSRNPLAHLHLGNAYLDVGRLTDAERELQLTVELAPGLAGAHANLGAVLAATGKPLEALGQFEVAAALAPASYKARLNAARVLLSLGRRDEAEAECRALLGRHPRLPEAEALLAEILGAQPSGQAH